MPLVFANFAREIIMLKHQSRRNFIKTTGLAVGLTAGLVPFARSATEPEALKRVMFVYIPGGAMPKHWQAKGCDSNFSLARMSMPLMPIKQNLVFINNLNMPIFGHGFPMNALGGNYNPARATLDIELGAVLSKHAPVKNLTLNSGYQLGNSVTKTLDGTQISIGDPYQVYATLFGDLPATAKGMLDEAFATGNYQDIRQDFDKLTQLHTQLSVLALQRNKTNVVSLMFGAEQSDIYVPIGDTRMEYHVAVSVWPENYIAGRAYLTEKFTYLVQLLEATKDANNVSLLDSTLVVMITDMGDGSTHEGQNVPFLLAGGKNFLRTNRLIDAAGYTHLDLLDTVSKLLDVPLANYGKGPIASILK